MTLSRFLRDYVYIPLGGNRKGQLITYRNLFLTFLIGGLWHGANWTFVIWGALHGMGICIHRFWKTVNIKIPHIISLVMTFLFVNFAFVYFRALTITKANSIILSMFGLNGFAPVVIDKKKGCARLWKTVSSARSQTTRSRRSASLRTGRCARFGT